MLGKFLQRMGLAKVASFIGLAGTKEKRILLIGGCARSGTTLIGRIVGSHPRIVLITERYLKLFMERFDEYLPNLFVKDRYFDFQPGDSGQFVQGVPERARAYYEAIKGKWDDALFVGDKIPPLILHAEELIGRFPDMKIIHISRNINDVCSSWNVRASNQSWPAHFDYQKAVFQWNESTRKALAFHSRHPDNIIFINYEEIYGDGNLELLLKAISPRLEVTREMTDHLLKEKAKAARLTEERETNRIIHPGEETYINEHAELENYKIICGLSIWNHDQRIYEA